MPTKKTPPKTAERGFSLIELLLVMTLLPLVFFSVYSNFTSGLRIWERVVRATPQEDLEIFNLKVRRDLTAMRRMSNIPFEGDRDQIVFAAHWQARPELGGARGIGRVRIFYDEKARAIVREGADYSQWYREVPGTRSVLLRDVGSFELSYLSKEPPQNLYTWSEFWVPEGNKLPMAVQLSFTVGGISEKQDLVVFIPVGGKFQ